MNDPLTRPKILIVDDLPENILMLMQTLKEDYAVIPATSGKMALQKAQVEPVPDLILLDIMMPQMNGYDVIKRLKRHENTRHIPVIFITAVDDAMDEASAFALGAADYITKPFNPITIKARVRTQLALKKYSEHLEELVNIRTAELKKAMHDLKQAKDSAEAANEAKTRFLANMSHELRTPMNGIITSLQLLDTYDFEPDVKEIHGIIENSGKNLLGLIENILSFAKDRRGPGGSAMTPFVLSDLLAGLKTNFFHKGVTTDVTINIVSEAKDVPELLIGDIKDLKAVFNNLLDNAVKFSQGSPVVTAGVKSMKQDKEHIILEFYVKDNGIGIAPEHFDLIFEPFSQIDTSISRPYDGAGIGLAACLKMVKQMGGQIWVESELGKGSIFYFTAEFLRQEVTDISGDLFV